MRALIVGILALAACGGEPPPTGPMTVTVDQYDFTFDLDSRAAHAAVHATVTTAGDCVTLPLRAALAGDVLLDGEVATADVAGDALTACGAGWRTGDAVVLEADLTVPLATLGATQVGYSIAADANAAPFYYLVSWIGGCDRFAPCDHAPDRFARYHFTVTHPAGVTVLCPGDVVAGATSTTCTFDREGGPTYSTFGLVASPGWDVVDAGAWDGLAVTVYDRAGAGVAEAIDPTWIGGYLAWLEDRFGPYPYGSALRVATGPTYWNGFEHPGNIVLADGLDHTSPTQVTYTDPVDHVLAHELTHQWAGDQTTLADTYDFVWKESMAEYLTFVYEDETAPATAAKTATLWKAWASGARYYPVPTDHPALVDYYGDAYGPGPMVLFRQLEALFSRDQVLAAIGQLLGAPHAISVDQVQAALEDTTGADLSTYFARWVRGAGPPYWPRFTIATADAGGGAVDVTLTQVGPAALFGCALAVELDGADASQRLDVPFDLGPDGTHALTRTVTPGFAVTATKLDPHATCLAFPGVGFAPVRHAPAWSPWVAR